MLENLKLALKRQKKLILIFCLTIFIPSISLSVFGIRAIRNERFRLAEQIENEHRLAAEDLKSQIRSHLEELSSTLESLAQSSTLMQQDVANFKKLLDDGMAGNSLVEQVFVAFNGEEPFFPLFQPVPFVVPSSSETSSEGILQERLKSAENYEFSQKNYKRAASLYQNLFNRSQSRNFKARMLASMARCLFKVGDYQAAIRNYQRICDDYPESVSSTGMPLVLISRLQMASCYRNLGESQTSIQFFLDLYRDIMRMQWPLKEAQFKTYATLVEDAIHEGLLENQPEVQLEDFKEDFDLLKNLHQEKSEQWAVVKDISQGVVPELRARQNAQAYASTPLQYQKIINGRNYLISAVQIPDSSGIRVADLLGVKIKEQHLIEDVIPAAIRSIPFSHPSHVVISHLSGKILLGEKNPSTEPATTTEFFRDNFPPWRIDIFPIQGGASGAFDLKRSFYFWTIITLVVVLISGAVLISRTIAQEMAVLRLKSDFVSSVSHEFKSPLTSIKSLAERLRDGKVKDSGRMKQYFSVITQDADRLARLVTNILDFSKIEEGKREYEFMETDLGQLVKQNIEDFQKEEIAKGVKIQSRIAEDIPFLDVDIDALTQALNNLLDNAVKFSPDRKEIDVFLEKDDKNVILKVKDNGIGIPASESDKIFDKFYQGRSKISLSTKGTGLGLTLVKHTVEAHGGRIDVESRVGEGSSFSIILPIQKQKK
ncbi:MAG: sensor histidine kinase [Candidatus Aminicenantes bacterium]|nr:MAG: sensor histidine kinase [Candidatus Aminicenantes bacterium]